jgi:hypothetical protein
MKRSALTGLVACWILSCQPAEPTKKQPAWAVPYGQEGWRRTAVRDEPEADASGGLGPRKTGEVDLSAVIERVGHAFRKEEGGRSRSRGSAFAASVSEDRGAVHFSPYLPSSNEAGDRRQMEHARPLPDGAELTWRFLGMERGGEPIARQPERWHLWGNTAQKLLEPDLGIVDHLLSGDRGIERSWYFPRPLGGQGDLLIRTEIRGMQLVATTNTGYHLGARSNLLRPPTNTACSSATESWWCSSESGPEVRDSGPSDGTSQRAVNWTCSTTKRALQLLRAVWEDATSR